MDLVCNVHHVCSRLLLNHNHCRGFAVCQYFGCPLLEGILDGCYILNKDILSHKTAHNHILDLVAVFELSVDLYRKGFGSNVHISSGNVAVFQCNNTGKLLNGNVVCLHFTGVGQYLDLPLRSSRY
ncbi:hypothetical protein SDC9_134339 [bioreactor metagenome]|uniref:Uncharacterized protein n=1 Tax=bioreactor metagenome TaxID=1076179 RepID=A0A645DCX6_9ZZZZ